MLHLAAWAGLLAVTQTTSTTATTAEALIPVEELAPEVGSVEAEAEPVLEAQPVLEDRYLPEVSVVDTLTAEFRRNNGNERGDDDDFSVFVNRLNLSSHADSVSLSLRLDTTIFADAPTDAYEDDVRIERGNVELTFGDATLVGGDFYRQLGRGILLSLRKVDEVGLDLALRGAEAKYAPEHHSLAVFAGVVNPANLDTVSLFTVEDPGDLLAGASYELSAIDGLTAGIHGLYAQPSERLLDDLDYTVSGGATAELIEIFEGMSIYGELDLQNRSLAGASELGSAAYLTADFLVGDLTLLLEAIKLTDFEQKGSRNTAIGSRFDYNIPPTLERIDQEVLSSRDVTGARLRVEYSFFDAALIAHANGMLRINDAGQPAEILQIHAYAGGEFRFDERLSKLALSSGFRSEQMRGTEIKSMIHIEGELVKSLVQNLALHLQSVNELRTLQERHYARGSTVLGLEWAGYGGLAFELGYDTQNPSEEVRKTFFAGILSADFSDVLRARLTAGTQRGGLKCVAGVCREFPAFSGVRSEIVLRW
jgi:hypothetical protein